MLIRCKVIKLTMCFPWYQIFRICCQHSPLNTGNCCYSVIHVIMCSWSSGCYQQWRNMSSIFASELLKLFFLFFFLLKKCFHVLIFYICKRLTHGDISSVRIYSSDDVCPRKDFLKILLKTFDLLGILEEMCSLCIPCK